MKYFKSVFHSNITTKPKKWKIVEVTKLGILSAAYINSSVSALFRVGTARIQLLYPFKIYIFNAQYIMQRTHTVHIYQIDTTVHIAPFTWNVRAREYQKMLELTQHLHLCNCTFQKQLQVNIHTVVVSHVQLHIKRSVLSLLDIIRTHPNSFLS